MLKKSLLSASLGQGQPASGQQPTQVPDNFSFPCVAGDNAPATIDGITEGIDRVSLRRMSLPGSAPTAFSKPGSFLVRAGLELLFQLERVAALQLYTNVAWEELRLAGPGCPRCCMRSSVSGPKLELKDTEAHTRSH